MDPTAIITVISQVIKLAVDVGPGVIKAVEDAAPFAEAIYHNLVSGQAVTPEQLTALEAQLQVLSDDLDVPLPVDDGTTTT